MKVIIKKSSVKRKVIIKRKKEEDISKGTCKEDIVYPFIKKKYNDLIHNKNDKFNPIDFISHSHKMCIELKSTEQLNLTYYKVGLDKYIHYQHNYKKKGYSFFVFYFIGDYLVYNHIKNIKNYVLEDFGRTDRERQELIKPHFRIQRKDFKGFKHQKKGYTKLDLQPIQLLLDFDDEDD